MDLEAVSIALMFLAVLERATGDYTPIFYSPLCQPGWKMTCLDHASYQMCKGGFPRGEIMTCSKWSVCSSVSSVACRSLYSVVKQDAGSGNSPSCRFYEICNIVEPKSESFGHSNSTECRYYSRCTAEDGAKPEIGFLYTWQNPLTRGVKPSKRMKRVSFKNFPSKFAAANLFFLQCEKIQLLVETDETEQVLIQNIETMMGQLIKDNKFLTSSVNLLEKNKPLQYYLPKIYQAFLDLKTYNVTMGNKKISNMLQNSVNMF